MKTYRVVWEMDIDANSPIEAAQEARKIQQDPENIANVFTVSDAMTTEEVDLLNMVSTNKRNALETICAVLRAGIDQLEAEEELPAWDSTALNAARKLVDQLDKEELESYSLTDLAREYFAALRKVAQ